MKEARTLLAIVVLSSKVSGLVEVLGNVIVVMWRSVWGTYFSAAVFLTMDALHDFFSETSLASARSSMLSRVKMAEPVGSAIFRFLYSAMAASESLTSMIS